jgi:hypothetical protein
MMAFNFHAEDSPADKVLDLPARSRFGEGRAKPLWDLITNIEKLMKSFFSKHKSYP